MTVLARHDAAFSVEQADIIKQVLCPEISDAQLAMFSQVCKRTGLDPFAKQIYATLRNSNEGTKERPRWVKKMTIQTGIDGFRLIAERTGKYAGQGEFQWCGDDGVWKDIWLSEKPPAAARATIYRSDWQRPIVRIARWKAYTQDNSMWRKMDAEQLAKCAEALCLRAAFPQDLSGLYTDDEMAQAEPVQARVVVEMPPPAAAEHKQLPPNANDQSWEEKHERVWGLYANSSFVEQPLTSIPTEKLVAYIQRLEATVKGPASSKTPASAANAKRASVDAVPYLAAARVELVERRKLEAEAAGADVETGELPKDDGGDEETDARFSSPVEHQGDRAI
jgi:phage recombination protein Bet